MSNESFPPAGCVWWSPGDETHHPPEDEQFLEKLAEAGFGTYVGSIGLLGARTEDRSVLVIHQGFGRRWEITLREREQDRHIANRVAKLPEQIDAAIAWLKGEPLDRVRRLLAVPSSSC